MGLFKRAAARGVAHELVRRGVVQFPSKEAADEAADAVADAMPEAGPGAMPEVSGEQGHSPEEIAAIANKLIEIGHALMAEAGGGGAPGGAPGEGGGAPGPVPPEIAKAAADLQKTASEIPLQDIAGKVAVECMDKAAAEKQAAGSLVHGGDHQNTPEAAKKVTELGALDQAQRPSGTYEDSRGHTALADTGHIGDLGKNPKGPHNTPAGSNSLTEGVHHKGASEQMREHVRKIAASLIHGGDKGNTQEQAAKVTEIGALDNKQRPVGYAVVGKGNANFSEPQASRVGTEEKHPNGPHNTPAGTNSVIQASKTGEELSEDDKAFLNIFSKCAEDVGPYLPAKLSEDEKIAAIRHMMGMEHDERQAYIDGLNGKQAGDLSEALSAMHGDEGKKHENKKHEEHEKHETPAEEKKEEKNKKEGALLEQIKKIAAAKSQQPRA
jgi:hypothetical protein